MTEAEWFAETDPTPMLVFLKGTSSDRKLRLFAVASCRGTSAWHLFPNDQCRAAINLAEQFAVSVIGWKQLWEAKDAVAAAKAAIREMHTAGYSWQMGGAWAKVAMEAATIPVIVPQMLGTCGFLRDIFGNPFRPVTLDPRWLTADVTDLARAIYDDKAFDRMPILADALMDAGCDDADIIGHCRGEGPHVRGCWVVDLLLGKQ